MTKKIFSPNNGWPQKNIAPQKMLESYWSPKKILSKRIYQTKLVQKSVVPSNFGSKTFGLKKMLIEKSLSKNSFTKRMNKNKLKLGWEKP